MIEAVMVTASMVETIALDVGLTVCTVQCYAQEVGNVFN